MTPPALRLALWCHSVRSFLALRFFWRESQPRGRTPRFEGLSFSFEGWWNCFPSSRGRLDSNLTVDQQGLCVRDPRARPQLGQALRLEQPFLRITPKSFHMAI